MAGRRSRRLVALLFAVMLMPCATSPSAAGNEANAAATTAATSKCDRAKFRIILDVGHTAESYGAMSARNVPEFEYNLNLGKRIEEELKADGFSEAFLLVTDGKARPSLMKRVASANKRGADLFLSIHHDSVPDIYVDKWEFEGKRRAFNDMFGGYSVFVSKLNPHYGASLRFARLLGNQMAGRDLQFARQYDQWFMGKFQRELLDIEAGVYRYDQLIVLKQTSMPAVLLESGSIINREEELVMASDEHKNKVAAAVASATLEYCETRGSAPPLVAQPKPKDTTRHTASAAHRRVAQPRLAQQPQRTAKKR
jgi:N-acetylmuramoyl-L-alanine amidase